MLAVLSPTCVNESLGTSVATHLSGPRVGGPFTTFSDSLQLMSLFAFTLAGCRSPLQSVFSWCSLCGCNWGARPQPGRLSLLSGV